MASTGLVKALWVGPYGHRLHDGTLLQTGITVCDIGADEAKASDNWQPVTPGPKGKE